MTTPVERIGPKPRTLLIATDLSARCDRAFDRAVRLAAVWGARLIAVTVVERSAVEQPFAGELPPWRRAGNPIERATARLRAHAAGVGTEMGMIVETGDPADVIARVAAEQDCDLIVCGIPRDETLVRFGLGSAVDRLLRRTAIPLLIARKRPAGEYGSIVAGTDFSPHARHALETAIRWFPGCPTTVLHTFDLPFAGMVADRDAMAQQFRQSAETNCAAFLDSADIPASARASVTTLVEQGAPEQIFKLFAENFDTDLVVLGAAPRSAALDFLIGNTATQIMGRLSCDTLIVRQP